MEPMEIRDIFKRMYLDWINNFLTIKRFSEYYGISEKLSQEIIKKGKEYHEQGV